GCDFRADNTSHRRIQPTLAVYSRHSWQSVINAAAASGFSNNSAIGISSPLFATTPTQRDGWSGVTLAKLRTPEKLPTYDIGDGLPDPVQICAPRCDRGFSKPARRLRAGNSPSTRKTCCN